jgi:hypothetical protein
MKGCSRVEGTEYEQEKEERGKVDRCRGGGGGIYTLYYIITFFVRIHFKSSHKQKVFVNLYEAQESILKNWFLQAGNRFLGSLRGLKYGL